MSTKYHFNTKTGNPNICRAQKNCPFGGPEVHFATKEQARKGYEAGQSGSFQKPNTTARTSNNASQLWTEEDDYRGAADGTVVEFRDGTRFVKTGQDTWETSAHGGYALGDEEMAEYTARKGITPGSRLVKDEEEGARVAATKKAPVKGTLKATTVQNASFEAGTEARRNFLLINHRDPEQLAAAAGKIKDQALVKDIQRFNEVKKRELELIGAYRKASTMAGNSKTQAQHDGYRKVMETKAEQIKALRGELQTAEEAIEGHAKRYAKQLVVHSRSLDSIERLAKQGIKASLPGVKDRIYKLTKLQKETKSVKALRKSIEGSKPRAVLQAAKEFGNPLYISRAERYAKASEVMDGLNREAVALQRAHSSVASETVKETVSSELKEIQERQTLAAKELQEATAGLKLFSDDLKAREAQEYDIARELEALHRFTS